ncbi:MAG: pitrilysin family protein [bacterium]|nr:pitrilysin family protein [bacterium]
MTQDFKKIVLDNGLRIILAPQAQSLATTVLILVEAGSKYETKEINGLSHFLEHMCFKGTKKRPTSIEISSELDGLGAVYNAFTDMEFTGYFAKARPDHFEAILDVISDMYLNQIFDLKEIEKERGVIIEELNMYEDLPMRRVQESFTNLLYGDQPAGWDIGGKKEVIKKLTRDDFIKYRNEHYLGQASLVVVAGRFDEEEAVEKIKTVFADIKTGKKTPKIKTIEQQDKPRILLKTKKTDQTHLVLGVRAFDLFDERKYALEVLADILGGGLSSRLFQKIRGEMGAAYYVNAGAGLYTDHGYLAASAGVDHAKINEVIEAILEEFKKLATEPIGEKELERAKNHLIGHLIMGLETSDQLAGFYGIEEIIARKIITPQELIKKIQEVKSGEIREIAKDIFQDSKLNLALIGPFEEPARFEKILSLK